MRSSALKPDSLPGDPFVIGVSCFLRTGPKLVLEVRKPGPWLQPAGKPPLIYLGCIGGSLEEGEAVIEALQREAREEIGCGITLHSARATVDISPGGVTVLEDCLIDDLRPAVIWETDPRDGYVPCAKVVVFVGETDGDPQPGDLPAVVLADPALISDIGTRTVTVAEGDGRWRRVPATDRHSAGCRAAPGQHPQVRTPAGGHTSRPDSGFRRLTKGTLTISSIAI